MVDKGPISFGVWSGLIVVSIIGLLIFINTGQGLVYQKAGFATIVAILLMALWFCQRKGLQLRSLLIEQKKLQDSEERYRKLVELSPNAVFVQIASKCVFVNATGIRLMGAKSAGEILGQDILDYIELLDKDLETKNHLREGEQLRYGEEPTRIEGQIKKLGAASRSVVLNGTSFIYQGRQAVQIIVRDVTERRKVITALQESEERYRALFERTANPILVIDKQGRYVDCNQAAAEYLELSKEEVVGRKVGDFTPSSGINDESLAVSRNLWEKGGTQVATYDVKGTKKLLELTITPMILGGRQVIFGVGKDITERKQAEEKIKYMAYHDSLTGLPNRLLFIDRMETALARARRKNGLVAILFIDLDFFKSINDTFGHSAGDKLLQEVANRLHSCVRETDTIARPGGDEFTILLDEIMEQAKAVEIANRILETLKEPWTIDGVEFCITPSIGIAVYPEDGTDSETLMKNADAAMYRAKELGRNRYQLYAPTTNETTFERMQKEKELYQALDREEFLLHYQPQYDLKSGRIIGVEALLRWMHPERGLVPPMEFIPLAEETGLIIPLGEWVLRTACTQNKAWQDKGIPPIRVAVNISPKQFQHKQFTSTITRILKETGLASCYLELEITENIAMQKLEYTRGVINEIKEMGVHISIDDFGSGYSSLGYLKNFPPIDRLKIDKSFVQDIDEGSGKQVGILVATIISMARKLKIDVIAEGVESEYQAEFLKKQRCHKIQGFLYSRPLPAEDLEAMLVSEKSWSSSLG